MKSDQTSEEAPASADADEFEEPVDETAQRDRMRRAGRVLREWVIVIVGAVVLAMVMTQVSSSHA